MIMSSLRPPMIGSVALCILLMALLTVALLPFRKVAYPGCASCDARHQRLIDRGAGGESPQISFVPPKRRRDASQ
jgi:hypothetical protein